jgi:hypothetical protein
MPASQERFAHVLVFQCPRSWTPGVIRATTSKPNPHGLTRVRCTALAVGQRFQSIPESPGTTNYSSGTARKFDDMNSILQRLARLEAPRGGRHERQ